MADPIKQAKAASKSEAHLYVWDVIIQILEGGATPARSDAQANEAANRVIAIARAESQRMLEKHDQAMRAVSQAVGNG